jgi:2-methylisocitrate lyase-like PEP mutase family enzyme
MPHSKLKSKISIFRQLHADGGLVLCNAWDVMSARLAEKSGSRAIATTSAGVAWSLGFADGHVASRAQVMQSAAAIVASTDLPVSIDMEDGLLGVGETMADLVRDLLAAGVVGVNIEDSAKGKSLAVEDGASRIRALREAASARDYPLFINARLDAYLRGETADAATLIERAKAYLAAGADGIFIPGLTDLAMCRQISAAISGPLNVMARPQAPTAAEFFAAGVKRYSAGSFLVESAYGHTLAQMKKFIESGVIHPDAVTHAGYGELNQIASKAK